MLVIPGRDMRTRCPRPRAGVGWLDEVGGDGDIDDDGESNVVSDEVDHPHRAGEDVMSVFWGMEIGAITCSLVILCSFTLLTLKQEWLSTILSFNLPCTTKRAR
jgi:hypothetical protein